MRTDHANTARANARPRTTWGAATLLFLLAPAVACDAPLVGSPADENVAPTVSSTSPNEGATGVAINATLSVTFSEPMDASTLSGASFVIHDGTSTVAGDVTYAGVTATFDPTEDLSGNTAYSVTIVDSVTDQVGNHLAADYMWTFTTGTGADLVAPMVSATVPTRGAIDVARNAPVFATFTEDIDPLTVTDVSFTLAQGTTVVPGTVSGVGATATFVPSASLDSDRSFTATLRSSITDAAGNELAEDFVWSFTTGTDLDTASPTVTATNPENGAVDVGFNAAVSATFNEPMNPLTLTTASFSVRDGTRDVPGTVENAATTTTFTPTEILRDNTTYTATIAATAEDLAENTSQAPTSGASPPASPQAPHPPRSPPSAQRTATPTSDSTPSSP